MSFVGKALGALTGSSDQAEAAGDASKAQLASTKLGIAEQRRQFDAIQKLFAPYITAGKGQLAPLAGYSKFGQPALAQQGAIAGLSGTAAQQKAIAAIQGSPEFKAITQQGENAILQNASATGGLRGGNTQASLAQFRPQLLSQLIDKQYGRLGGLTALGQTNSYNLAGLGQSSAAGQAAQGAQSANSISDLIQQGGAAQAGGILAQGQQGANDFGSVLGIAGVAAGFF